MTSSALDHGVPPGLIGSKRSEPSASYSSVLLAVILCDEVAQALAGRAGRELNSRSRQDGVSTSRAGVGSAGAELLQLAAPRAGAQCCSRNRNTSSNQIALPRYAKRCPSWCEVPNGG